jgi:hypothetical protein
MQQIIYDDDLLSFVGFISVPSVFTSLSLKCGRMVFKSILKSLWPEQLNSSCAGMSAGAMDLYVTVWVFMIDV